MGTPARPPCTAPSRRGAVLRGHAPVHASSYDSARERCGGWPPAAPLPLMNCTTPHTKCTPPPGFHMRCTLPRGSGAVGAPPPRRAVEPSTEPQARASGIVRDDGRLAMSISAHAARSTSAVGCRQSDCSRQRFAGCRVGEYMSSGCGVYLVLIAPATKPARTNKRPTLPVTSAQRRLFSHTARHAVEWRRRQDFSPGFESYAVKPGGN